MDTRKQQNILFHGKYKFKITSEQNGTLIASLVETPAKTKDDIGALYYVVVVIMLYATSILLMMASYIKKNKMDSKVNRYLKDMARVRKYHRHAQVFATARAFASATQAAKIQSPAGGGKRAKLYAETSLIETACPSTSTRGAQRLSERRGAVVASGRESTLHSPLLGMRRAGPFHGPMTHSPALSSTPNTCLTTPQLSCVSNNSSFTFTTPCESDLDDCSANELQSVAISVPLLGDKQNTLPRSERNMNRGNRLVIHPPDHQLCHVSSEDSQLESDTESQVYARSGGEDQTDADEAKYAIVTSL